MAPTLVTETSLTLNNFHEHPLVRVEATMNVHDPPPYQEFICDGCNTLGSGSVDVRYRCNQCPLFDLHEVCAICPKKLSTHIHPIHQMVLVWRPPTSETNDLLLAAGCDVCGDEVKGLYYTCLQLEPPEEDNNSTSSCKGIVLHPICSKFPLHVQQHGKDQHPLAFQKATASPCTICNKICDSWRYRCETCNTNIHPECVSIPCHETKVLVDESAKPSKQQPQRQRQLQPSPLPSSNINGNGNYYPQSDYHQEKRPAADSPFPNSGYPPPQPPHQLVPMHQQWPATNNYPPPPMHQLVPMHQQWPATNNYPPPPMHQQWPATNNYPPPPPMHQLVPMHQQWLATNNYPPPPMHHHHQQYFYPEYYYYLYNTYLQQTAAAAYQAEGGGGGGASSSGGSKKKRRMFLVVGKIIATVAFSTALGIHIPF